MCIGGKDYRNAGLSVFHISFIARIQECIVTCELFGDVGDSRHATLGLQVLFALDGLKGNQRQNHHESLRGDLRENAPELSLHRKCRCGRPAWKLEFDLSW